MTVRLCLNVVICREISRTRSRFRGGYLSNEAKYDIISMVSKSFVLTTKDPSQRGG